MVYQIRKSAREPVKLKVQIDLIVHLIYEKNLGGTETEKKFREFKQALNQTESVDVRDGFDKNLGPAGLEPATH